MKKIILTTMLFFAAIPAFAQDRLELKNGCEYLYFSEERVTAIKSNNPTVISAQRISVTGDEGQIIFYPKKAGIADVQIQTSKGVKTYNIEIKNGNVKNNDIFMELDIPGIRR